jgi:hypothetical protein
MERIGKDKEKRKSEEIKAENIEWIKEKKEKWKKKERKEKGN